MAATHNWRMAPIIPKDPHIDKSIVRLMAAHHDIAYSVVTRACALPDIQWN